MKKILLLSVILLAGCSSGKKKQFGITLLVTKNERIGAYSNIVFCDSFQMSDTQKHGFGRAEAKWKYTPI